MKSPWVCVLVSHVRLFVIPQTVACQAPLSMKLSRQEYWNGLSFPPPEDLPYPGTEPGCPALGADSLPSEPPGSLLTLPFTLFRQPVLQKAADTVMPEAVNPLMGPSTQLLDPETCRASLGPSFSLPAVHVMCDPTPSLSLLLTRSLMPVFLALFTATPAQTIISP